jgi:hypothetical protein
MAISKAYTVAFHEPRFTAQVTAASVGEVRKAIEASGWFSSSVARHLSAEAIAPSELHFQLQELDGLVSTWAGFFGYRGVYAPFVLVRACAVAAKEPHLEFVAFVP